MDLPMISDLKEQWKGEASSYCFSFPRILKKRHRL